MADKDNHPPMTKKQIEKWREQVKQRRHELFSRMSFDKYGRLIKEIR